MAFECQWPAVSAAAPSSSIVPIVTTTPHAPGPALSFASALAGKNSIDDIPFPTPCFKGDALSIKIC